MSSNSQAIFQISVNIYFAGSERTEPASFALQDTMFQSLEDEAVSHDS